MRKFLVGDVDGRDNGSQFLRDLHRQMTETAYTKNRHLLPGLDFRVLQSAIHGDARTEQRRDGSGGKPLRNLERVTRGSFHKLRVSTIHSDAGNFLVGAEVFVPF